MEKRINCQRILSVLLIILILLTIFVIWGQSVKDVPSSNAESIAVLELIKPWMEPIIGQGKITNHLIRKLAHFIEYAVLGAEVVLLLVASKRVTVQNVVNCLFFGVLVALTDETIQLFMNRGAQVQDVLLDCVGLCFGMAVVGTIAGIVLQVCAKRVENNYRRR